MKRDSSEASENDVMLGSSGRLGNDVYALSKVLIAKVVVYNWGRGCGWVSKGIGRGGPVEMYNGERNGGTIELGKRVQQQRIYGGAPG